jgi:hypothetical protein
MTQFTSVFTNECWRLVGDSAANPEGLQAIFQEHEALRERLAQFDTMHKGVIVELERANIEVQRLRKDLGNFRERETVHIRPLLTALMQHLLYPGEGESPVGLRARIERTRAFKVDAGLDKEAPAGLLEELEKQRREYAALAERNKSLEEEIQRRIAAAQQPDEKDRELAKAMAMLEEAQEAAAAAKRDSLEAVDRARSLEGASTQYYRVRVANKRLSESIREWEEQIKERDPL